MTWNGTMSFSWINQFLDDHFRRSETVLQRSARFRCDKRKAKARFSSTSENDRLSTFRSSGSMEVALKMSIASWRFLSTNKRRYPPHTALVRHATRSLPFDITLVHIYRQEGKKRDPDSQGSVERPELEWSGTRGKGSIGRLGPGV